MGNGLGEEVGDGLGDTVGVGVGDTVGVGLGDVVGLGVLVGDALGDRLGVGVPVALVPGVLTPGTPPDAAAPLRVGEAFGSDADGEPEQDAIGAQAINASTPKPTAVSLARSPARGVVACTFIGPPDAFGRWPPSVPEMPGRSW